MFYYVTPPRATSLIRAQNDLFCERSRTVSVVAILLGDVIAAVNNLFLDEELIKYECGKSLNGQT